MTRYVVPIKYRGPMVCVDDSACDHDGDPCPKVLTRGKVYDVTVYGEWYQDGECILIADDGEEYRFLAHRFKAN